MNYQINMTQNIIPDMKLVMDFIPNHSSDEHEWFQKSVAREDPYTDYYMWQDPIGTDPEGNPIPPNNWVQETNVLFLFFWEIIL